MKWILPLCVVALPVFGETCPPEPDKAEDYARLFNALRDAPSEAVARDLNNALWALWTAAPDARAQALLDEGMRQRANFDFLSARDTFDALVAYCPAYAEGYNQRAFASYLRQDFTAALVDLDKALALRPDHLGALSGKALTLIGLDRPEEAQAVLRAALALNPWLPERGLLVRPAGTDL